MRRGSICWVDLDPARRSELGKTRPAVVVSSSTQNSDLPSVGVVPLSSRPPEIWPLRVRLQPRPLARSYAVVPGIRQVSKERIVEVVDMLSDDDLGRLSDAIGAYLSQ